MFKNGNEKGARALKSLQRDMDISDDQAKDITKKWLKLTGHTRKTLPHVTNIFGKKVPMTKAQITI